MSSGPVLESPRLRLRRFSDADREAFAAINRDPEVTAHLLGAMSRAESDALVDRINGSIDQNGFGFFCAEWRATGECIGMIGLARVKFALSRGGGPPEEDRREVEIGWRLARAYWGQGLATEGARRALDFAFGELGLDEVVSFTSLDNVRSYTVMERLGMQRDGEFDHPAIAPGHRLRRHMLYRLGTGSTPLTI